MSSRSIAASLRRVDAFKDESVNSADAWLAKKDAPRPQPEKESSNRVLEWVPAGDAVEREDPEQPGQAARPVPDREEPAVEGAGRDARELVELLRAEVEALTRRIEELEAELSAAGSDADTRRRWAG
jgi:hypothetical protein